MACESDRQYVSLKALGAWLKHESPDLSVYMEDSKAVIRSGDKDLCDPFPMYGECSTTTEDLRSLISMTEVMSGDLQPYLRLLTGYIDLVEKNKKVTSVWDLAKRLQNANRMSRVAFDKSKMEKGLGPKGRSITRLTLMFEGVPTVIICSGEAPRLVCPAYRFIEDMIQSPFDKIQRERILRTFS